jgi:hypothetical protein
MTAPVYRIVRHANGAHDVREVQFSDDGTILWVSPRSFRPETAHETGDAVQAAMVDQLERVLDAARSADIVIDPADPPAPSPFLSSAYPPEPWRRVVDTTKVSGRSTKGSNRHLHAHNILECGHRFEVRGERALDAKYVKRRRCRDCAQAMKR